MGLSAEEPDEEPDSAAPDIFYLWPCNLHAWALWQRLQTQWRVGAQGHRAGLDYTAVMAYLERVAGLRKKAFTEMFSAIQAMERACLEVWADSAN